MNFGNFYKDKRVFITGHTGFKGSWMCKVLSHLGAKISGYSLEPPTNPNLYTLVDVDSCLHSSTINDVRNLKALQHAVCDFQPDIVIHMAAQPIVRESYSNPVETYEINVMGTVHILEAIRACKSVKSFVNVTTDKVYRNNEWDWGYRENEYLDGFDPYSNSKSCSELVTSSYKKSFFSDNSVAISTCRAGNVIGGGDFAKDRIIPDSVRAMEHNTEILLRNPYSTRPYQHVLESVCTYLLVAMKQYEDVSYADSYNVGPNDSDCVTTKELVELFGKFWGPQCKWQTVGDVQNLHEANYLKLDSSKIKSRLSWAPRWHIEDAIEKTVEWSKAYLKNDNLNRVMETQIKEYLMED